MTKALFCHCCISLHDLGPEAEAGSVRPPSGGLFVWRYLSTCTRASLRRSAVNATAAPMTMRASVAPKLPGAMQLIQVPMTTGASYTVRSFSMIRLSLLNGPGSATVNPLSFAWERLNLRGPSHQIYAHGLALTRLRIDADLEGDNRALHDLFTLAQC
jgi:hypothetical protein